MNKNMIEIGDKVNIHWERIRSEFECEVLYIPMSEGDSYSFQRKDNTIFYVQHFCKIEKV